MALEKQYQAKFTKWAQHEWKGTAVFELKKCSDRLPFDAVKEHQIHALHQAKHGKIIFKIPDLGLQNPFDCFAMERVGAYVVVFFEDLFDKREGNNNVKEFFLIDVDAFINERDSSKFKSLSIERAKEIGMRRSLKAKHK